MQIARYVPWDFVIVVYVLLLLILWLFLRSYSCCLEWTLRATVCFVKTGCLHIYTILVFFSYFFFFLSLVPSESNLNMGPSLNLMLEAMPLFLFKSYFESLPYSKLMDWSIKLWLLLVCFSSTFCFPLFLVHIPTSSTPGLQNLLFVLKLKTEDCVKGNFLFLHEKNVLGTLIEDVSESSDDTDAITRRLSIPIWVPDQCFLKYVWLHWKA